MVGSYLTIIILIYKRSRLSQQMTGDDPKVCRVIGRAKIKTINITGVLVCGFVLCWTPYNAMSLW